LAKCFGPDVIVYLDLIGEDTLLQWIQEVSSFVRVFLFVESFDKLIALLDEVFNDEVEVFVELMSQHFAENEDVNILRLIPLN